MEWFSNRRVNKNLQGKFIERNVNWVKHDKPEQYEGDIAMT